MRFLEPEILGKTFDDFLFRPQHGITGRTGITDLGTRFSRNITLNFPVVSANMDTVTESLMAIEMARWGGIGVIHRNMSIRRQATEVKRVKRAENFIITDPYTLRENETVGDAKNLMDQKKVHSLLVIDSAGKLRGILTWRDIKFLSDGPKDNRILVRNRMTSIRSGKLVFHHGQVGSYQEAMKIMDTNRIKKLPLVDKEMQAIGLITAKDVEKLQKHPFANKDSQGRLRVAAAIGAVDDFLERASALIKAGVDVLVMDIAHGDSEFMKRGAIAFRDSFNNFELVCGNVATGDGALFLKELGVDGIKIGIGPGHGCRTRLETGAGVAQLEAIRDVYCAVGEETPKIADGGVRYGKDFWFALGFGADCIMLGAMLSGTDESPGQIITDPATKKKFKIYRGMTSPEAKIALQNELPENIRTPTFIEGQERKVEYAGSVNDILQSIKESIQTSISYAGEKTLSAARAKVAKNPLEFFQTISEAAKRESYER